MKLDASGPAASLAWRGDNEAISALITTPVIDGRLHLRHERRRTGLLGARNRATTLAFARADQGAHGVLDRFIVRNGDRYFINTERGDLVIARLSPAGYEEMSRATLIEPTHPNARRQDLGRALVASGVRQPAHLCQERQGNPEGVAREGIVARCAQRHRCCDRGVHDARRRWRRCHGAPFGNRGALMGRSKTVPCTSLVQGTPLNTVQDTPFRACRVCSRRAAAGWPSSSATCISAIGKDPATGQWRSDRGLSLGRRVRIVSARRRRGRQGLDRSRAQRRHASSCWQAVGSERQQRGPRAGCTEAEALVRLARVCWRRTRPDDRRSRDRSRARAKTAS